VPQHQSYSLSDEQIIDLVFRKYGVKITPEQIARAYAPEQKMSWKKSVEVARFINGMTLKQAKTWLEDVVKLRRPIPIKTFKRSRPTTPRLGAGGPWLSGPSRSPGGTSRSWRI